MKLTIEGTQEEIKNTLQAISGSKERADNPVKINMTMNGDKAFDF